MSFDQFYAQGMDLVASPQAQKAFDIETESDKVRDAYGRNDLRNACSSARRLVEVGVSFVTVYLGGWDHHTKIFESYRGSIVRNLDQGISALINDLDDRGLLDSTLVLALGEFGRTPKVNKDAGRDHWPGAMSVLMARAKIPRGQIVGATDAKGYYASESIYKPEDMAASLYTKMALSDASVAHNHRPAGATCQWRATHQGTVRVVGKSNLRTPTTSVFRGRFLNSGFTATSLPSRYIASSCR